VTVDGARCYVPITGLGAPTLRSAKEVLARGETRTFVVQALDPPRRGIELALPGLAQVAGEPTEETVAAEITEARPQKGRTATKKKAAAKASPRKAAAPAKKQAAAKVTPTKRTPAKATNAKATTAKRGAAKKGAAKKGAAAKKGTDAVKRKATKKQAAAAKSAP
jgi:hypothetical protein